MMSKVISCTKEGRESLYGHLIPFGKGDWENAALYERLTEEVWKEMK